MIDLDGLKPFVPVFQGAGVLISFVALFFTFRVAHWQRQRDRSEHVNKVFLWSRVLNALKEQDESYSYEVNNASTYPLQEVRIGHRPKFRRVYFYVRNVGMAASPSQEVLPGERIATGPMSSFVGVRRIRATVFVQDAWGYWWRRAADKPDQWDRLSHKKVPEIIGTDQVLPRRLKKLRAAWAESARIAAVKHLEQDMAWKKTQPGSMWYEPPKAEEAPPLSDERRMSSFE